MRFTIYTTCTAMVLAFAGAALADEKIDPAKLVGKWEQKDPEKGEKFTAEFAKDGKVKILRKFGDDEFSIDGTYKVEGNKMTIKVSFKGKEDQVVITIDKLTDDELTTTDDMKKTKNFKRAK